jgi:cobalt/nickel transport system permease protein
MAILGSLFAGWLCRRWMGNDPRPARLFWAGFGSAWLTVTLSAFACASQLALSGVVRWGTALGVLGGFYTLLGVVEGLVTGTVLQSIHRSRPDLLALGRRTP